MIWVLAACQRPETGDDPPGDTVVTGSTAATASTAESAAPTGDHSAAPPLPLVDEALAARCPDPTPPVPPRRSPDLHRVTLATTARCNDGTPPVVYVAPASDPAHAADWVISLDPGSFCVDAEACAARWCGEDGYDASKMSSRWAEETAAAGGIVSARADNAFAGFHRVSVPYCSSDLWTGTAGEHAFVDGDPPYRVFFEGAAILDAALDALAAGVTSDDGAVTLAPLTAPGTVVLAGSSASAFGWLQRADEIAARLGAARTTVVLDGWTTHPAPGVVDAALQAAVDAETEAAYVDRYAPVWGMTLDASCLAAEAEPWRCTDGDRMLRTHLATPRVVRSDLRDPVVYGFWAAFGVGPADYPALVEATLRAEGGAGRSVLGTACGTHVVSGGDAFFDTTVRDARDGGPAWSLHAALVAHGLGVDVSAVDTPAGDGSVCR